MKVRGKKFARVHEAYYNMVDVYVNAYHIYEVTINTGQYHKWIKLILTKDNGVDS